jgi:hypothetical protein
MKTKQNIDILLENGIHFSTLSTMTESQIRVLAEKAKKSKKKDLCPCGCEKDNCPCGPDCKKCDCGKSKKKETKEEVSISKSPESREKVTVTGTGEFSVDGKTFNLNGGQLTGDLPSGSKVEALESQELGERFKSKAQQKLFFVKCGNGKTKEQKKWCKLRDEFARDTTKRDYKDLPDYVDDKDEKPKRKSRKKPTSKKRKTSKRKGVKKEDYEKLLEDRIVEMIDNHINPAMTKGKLIDTITEKRSENFILRNPKKLTMFSNEEGVESKGRRKKMKLPIGRITSLGMMEEDLEEDTKTAPTKDPKTKPGTKKPGRRNPFKRPGTTPKEKPRAEKGAEKQKSDFMLVIKQVLNIS